MDFFGENLRDFGDDVAAEERSEAAASGSAKDQVSGTGGGGEFDDGVRGGVADGVAGKDGEKLKTPRLHRET